MTPLDKIAKAMAREIINSPGFRAEMQAIIKRFRKRPIARRAVRRRQRKTW